MEIELVLKLPFTYILYEVTATLSVEAFHVKLADAVEVEITAKLDGAVGAWVSVTAVPQMA
ncbi:hypothetical protein SDC9_201936 [bioreactor metagenome]|uniref:Uncharacterized protein n=1 Tax=bioreactor metagenome TaxID=1076179 RepID=A0A645IT11_9ZZZZ